MYQLRLDQMAKRRWEQYSQANPDIKGENEMPQGFNCQIF